MVRIYRYHPVSLMVRNAFLSAGAEKRALQTGGHSQDRAPGDPSSRPLEERGHLSMRSEVLISIGRYEWFHGIGRLAVIISAFAGDDTVAAMPDRINLGNHRDNQQKGEQPCRNVTTFLI
jgi:hypothetical protein